ncbi:hypothetical protein EJ110_NYTH10699 [Nymphaea thermarum]|nr:hypothetical protein EJ110_NYTH10699 [Nymphaea thermarum]
MCLPVHQDRRFRRHDLKLIPDRFSLSLPPSSAAAPQRPLVGFYSSLDAKFNLQRLSVDLNVTLELGLSVKNPNKVSFKYHNSSSLLYYRGRLVGQADIPAGEIFAGQTIDTHSVLTILADRLLSDSNAYTDAIAGSLPMTAFTKISGTVTILRMFKIHLVSYTDCELSIDVRNRTVEKSDCKYKTKY